ncbi:MAG: hypothetical protein HZA78_12425 [Candidatus Schekmanbacteria bacterium]|nr:hypothetical protein [Candidatus Schekmanbacteria bacterium]
MRSINRTVIIIKAKQPYVDWANSFDDGEPPMKLEEFQQDATAYLIPQFDYIEQSVKYIEKHYAEIFESELADWMTAPHLWPPKRTLKMFRKWFEVGICGMVIDMDKKPVLLEEYQ